MTRPAAVALLAFWLAPGAAHAEWSVAAFAGAASTHAADLTLRRADGAAWITVPEVRFDAESFRSPIYYGYRIGHTLGRSALWLEGELIHLKVIADPLTLRMPVQQLAMSHGMNFVLANVAWIAPLRAGSPVAWSARAGLGATLPHVEATVGGAFHEGYQTGGLGVQLAPGVRVRLSSRFHATAEYKFTAARPSVGIDGGTASTALRTHHVAFGLAGTF